MASRHELSIWTRALSDVRHGRGRRRRRVHGVLDRLDRLAGSAERRAAPRGAPRIRFPGSDGRWNKKTARKRNCFFSRSMIRPPRSNGATGNRRPPIADRNHPSKMKSGSGLRWTIQARLHTSITLCRPYALRMQPYAARMHFFAEIEKPIKSRAESTCKKPYALYAPLLGVGPFFAFFLLREMHTVHTAAYDRKPNRALALLPVGIEASPAREDRKCIRKCIRLFGRKTPIGPLPHRPAPSDAWDGTWQTSPS